MIYQLCKKVIKSGDYVKDAMLVKLDVYLKTKRITEEQYAELVAMME